MGDEIFLVRRHAGAALAAAALHAILGERRALDVAAMRHGNGDVLALDQVFVFDLDFGIDDFGPARRGEFVAHRRELVLHDRKHARTRAQDVEIVGDRDAELLHLVGELGNAKRGQARQAQLEDRLGLLLGEPDRVVRLHQMARIGDQRDQRRRRPWPARRVPSGWRARSPCRARRG